MLEYKSLSQHTDLTQRVWVYSHQRGKNPWVETYCFAETEFFATDFEVLNHITMTSPRSFFAQNIVVQRFLLEEIEGKQKITGVLLLFKDRVKSRTGESEEILEVLENEDQRVQAFEKHFKISLADHERRAIHGLASELKK
jgi:arylamine N-acetyltransferase